MMMMMVIFAIVVTIIIINKYILPKEVCTSIRGLYCFFLIKRS